MTDKQVKFCQEYIIDLNATQAAIRAGYSETSAKQIGSDNMTKHDVAEYIAQLQEQAAETAKLNIQWVLNRFREISDRCMQAEPVMIRDGKEWVESGEYQFDSSGASKAAEMIAKHLGFFESDNKQKTPIISPAVNVYTSAPPLASNENEVDDAV